MLFSCQAECDTKEQEKTLMQWSITHVSGEDEESTEMSEIAQNGRINRQFGTCNFGGPIIFLGSLRHLFREVTNAPLSCPTRWPISHNCATLISKSGRRGDTGRANTDSYRALVPSKDEEVIENITNSSQGIKIHNRTLARPSLMRHLHR